MEVELELKFPASTLAPAPRSEDFSRGEDNSGFFQVLTKSVFLGGGNSGKISFYQIETKMKAFFY